jgi:hypothetical protein
MVVTQNRPVSVRGGPRTARGRRLFTGEHPLEPVALDLGQVLHQAGQGEDRRWRRRSGRLDVVQPRTFDGECAGVERATPPAWCVRPRLVVAGTGGGIHLSIVPGQPWTSAPRSAGPSTAGDQPVTVRSGIGVVRDPPVGRCRAGHRHRRSRRRPPGGPVHRRMDVPMNADRSRCHGHLHSTASVSPAPVTNDLMAPLCSRSAGYRVRIRCGIAAPTGAARSRIAAADDSYQIESAEQVVGTFLERGTGGQPVAVVPQRTRRLRLQ